MEPTEAASARTRLVDAGIALFRWHGYGPTSVDEVCTAAGVTKGAFFHHFRNKEAFAEACLDEWNAEIAADLDATIAAAASDPVARLTAGFDGVIAAMQRPEATRSCLAGTIAQEVSESNVRLREAANRCLHDFVDRFERLIAAAAAGRGRNLEAASLARLWAATLQGTLILQKAARDEALVLSSLRHVRNYILQLLERTEPVD